MTILYCTDTVALMKRHDTLRQEKMRILLIIVVGANVAGVEAFKPATLLSTRRAIVSPPPAGFEWSDEHACGIIVPTARYATLAQRGWMRIATGAREYAPKACKVLVGFGRDAGAYSLNHLREIKPATLKFHRHAVVPPPPPGFEWSDFDEGLVLTPFRIERISDMGWTLIIASGKRIRIVSSATKMYWTTLLALVEHNAPKTSRQVIAIKQGMIHRGQKVFDDIATVAAATWVALLARLREHAPETRDLFVSIGRGVGTASQEYATVAASAISAYWATLSTTVKHRAPKLYARVERVSRIVGIVSQEYATVAATVISAYWAALSARLREHAPETRDAFVNIGRGVGTASQEYAAVVATMSAAYWAALLARLREHAPETRDAFVSIGRGVGTASQECATVAATALRLTGQRSQMLSSKLLQSFMLALNVFRAAWASLGMNTSKYSPL